MRWDVRCHTDCDTGSTVYQKVRVAGRHNNRLFFGFIKVRGEVYGVFVDIRQHLHRDFAQTCLRVSHSRSTVAVDGTEVSMAVYHRIAGCPVLCHIDECSVDRAVTVRVIFTHGITDDTRALTVRLIRRIVQFTHGVQNTSLYRL